MVEDEDGAWFYGVEPGGVAGHGATGQEAHQDFLVGYRSVLADLAAEAKGFPSFEVLALDFLSTVNRPTEEEWRGLFSVTEPEGGGALRGRGCGRVGGMSDARPVKIHVPSTGWLAQGAPLPGDEELDRQLDEGPVWVRWGG